MDWTIQNVKSPHTIQEIQGIFRIQKDNFCMEAIIMKQGDQH